MIHALAQKVVAIINPAAIKNNASYTSGIVDTRGFRYAAIYFMLGATDIALTALKVRESEDSGMSGAVDVTGADFSVAPATLPSATDDNHIFAVFLDLRNRKRYLDVVATWGNGTSGGFLVAWAELSRAEQVPANATNRGLTQQLIV